MGVTKKNDIEFNSFEYRATAPLLYNNNFLVEIGKDSDDQIIGRVVNEKMEITMKAKFKMN